jgi:hypothetical protein
VYDPAEVSALSVHIEELISYWHTAEDTLDKIGLRALGAEYQYRVAQLLDLKPMQQAVALYLDNS